MRYPQNREAVASLSQTGGPPARLRVLEGALHPPCAKTVVGIRTPQYDPLMDLTEVRRHLRRTPWNDFPDVHIYADVQSVKSHSAFSAAKAGDALAAEALIDDILAVGSLDDLRSAVGPSRPHLLAVHAAESAGMNAIPRAFALAISRIFGDPIASGIIQMNRVLHTGADGYHRLSFPPVFEGGVDPVEYVLVDDFVAQGGTLANLKGYVETNGGRVAGAVVLCGKAYSAKLRLTNDGLEGLRKKHGRELEEWWIATFGYGFESLTESEARYLTRSRDADAIRARLAAARGTGDR
jgi:hypothetical protein